MRGAERLPDRGRENDARFQAPCPHVIHAVGPAYQAESPVAAYLLASVYRRSLDLASEAALNSIAFPAISTGVYGYLLEEAADIAVGTCAAFALSRESSIRLIRFVLFGQSAYVLYTSKLASLGGI